ncbi:hypothetical protein [Lamprocystis purpurea]|uniref:hypothetical protein n=1 Tax=Lamprocystis purpurea TaxID=61598 RepID=UPI0003667F66|nr:hypothetical protein [Lamprocystis purpurea]
MTDCSFRAGVNESFPPPGGFSVQGVADTARGSFGKKKTPISSANYLDVAGTVSADNLAKVDISVSGPYSIEWSKFSDTDVNVGIKYLTVAGGQVGFSRNAAKSANLVLMKISLAEIPLKRLLNNHANIARNFLKDEGNDARIVSADWIVMEGELASKITSGVDVSASAPVGTSGFTLNVSTRTSSTVTTKVQIPPQTCFAYMMSKVKKWDKEDGNWMVEDLEDDMQGLN